MRDQLFFDGAAAGRKLTRFWVLLGLAAVIATCGVIGDSTATVIGAMIVAPLMVPILGTVLGVVTADAENLVRSLLLVVAGACAVIAIGFLFGYIAPVDVESATNSQVAARVHPRIIDLIAALATGAVGAFALSRSDVSDTLPGVAIAISLVPPLAVVGLTLEAGEIDESRGALLLFLTNVGAILLSGLIVMAIFRVSATARAVSARGNGMQHRIAVGLAIAFVVLLAIPLGAATISLTEDRLETGEATDAAKAWAEPAGWRVIAVEVDNEGILISAAGALPAPPTEELRAALDAEGLEGKDVRLELVPLEMVELPGR
jgi:uncharacterized hydrophobic protein (TIGR00271 family)